MKIVKEISDTRFEVELEPRDYERKTIDLVIAHDYVQFGASMSLFTDHSSSMNLKSKHRYCCNAISIYNTVQIPIRAFVEVVLPILSDNEYCQSKHLVCRDGSANYISETPLRYYKDGVEMIAIPDGSEYYHMPWKVYNRIRKEEQ